MYYNFAQLQLAQLFIIKENENCQEEIAVGFTLLQKLKRSAAIRWYILHGSEAPFKFET